MYFRHNSKYSGVSLFYLSIFYFYVFFTGTCFKYILYLFLVQFSLFVVIVCQISRYHKIEFFCFHSLFLFHFNFVNGEKTAKTYDTLQKRVFLFIYLLYFFIFYFHVCVLYFLLIIYIYQFVYCFFFLFQRFEKIQIIETHRKNIIIKNNKSKV